MSTTMAFVRLLTLLLRDRSWASTSFPLFRRSPDLVWRDYSASTALSIRGQLYVPADAGGVMYYRRISRGRFWRRASAAGSMCSGLRPVRLTPITTSDDPFLHLLLDVRVPAGGDFMWAAGICRRGFDRRNGRAYDLAGEGCSTRTGTAM